MRLRSGILALLLFALAAMPALAETKLAWNLKEGDTFYAQVATASKQRISVFGQDMSEDTDQTTVVSYKVLKKTGDGGLIVEQKIESLKSDGGGVAAALFEDLLKKLEGTTCKLVLDKNMQVSRVEDAEEVVKKVSDGFQGAGGQIPEQFIGTLVVGKLQEPAQQVFGIRLPDKPVAKGDKWDFKTTLPGGIMMLGNASMVEKYEYVGEEGGKAKVSTETAPTFSGNEFKMGPVSISKVEFKADKTKGTFLFDAQGGRLVSRDAPLKFRMGGVLSLNGQELPVELEFEVNSKTKITDKAP